MVSDRSISNLALTGFMGVGKSTLGRYLANTLGYQFIDTDELIETRAGRPISEIFATDGEEFFRQLEHDLVKEMRSWTRTVISTGGGLITKNDNLDVLKSYSFVVCLWASPTTIYHRVKRQQHRPLLNTADPLAKITELLAQRASYYKRSDLIVVTDQRPLRLVAQLVSRQFFEALNKGKQAKASIPEDGSHGR